MSVKILIIEDHDEIRESTAEILAMTGYEVFTAPEGKRGVAMALEHLPDLILCDIMMPVLDGFGVLYLLARNPATAKIPFIFLTAKAERSDMRKAMEMGADDYLTKPFDDTELLRAIEVRLKKASSAAAASAASAAAAAAAAAASSPAASAAADLPISDAEQQALLERLIENARVKTYKRKQMIYQEQDTPRHLFYLRKGTVRSYLFYPDGRELSTGIFSANSFFGYESLLLQEQYVENAETLDDAEICLIHKDEFLEMLYRRPVVAGQFMRLLSGNIREKEEQLLGFAYNSVRKRVADALIHVGEKSLSDPSQDQCLIRVTRDDLASIAGTALETVSRMLSDFRHEELISKEGNAIRIHSLSSLRNIKQ